MILDVPSFLVNRDHNHNRKSHTRAKPNDQVNYLAVTLYVHSIINSGPFCNILTTH